MASNSSGYVTLVRVEFSGTTDSVCFEEKEFAAIRRAMDYVDKENSS